MKLSDMLWNKQTHHLMVAISTVHDIRNKIKIEAFISINTLIDTLIDNTLIEINASN